jgi:hypothetical protein
MIPSIQMRRTTLYRVLTGPDDAAFCHRVSDALSKGWVLYGSPSMTFDPIQGRVLCAQAITKDIEGEYRPDMKLSEA